MRRIVAFLLPLFFSAVLMVPSSKSLHGGAHGRVEDREESKARRLMVSKYAKAAEDAATGDVDEPKVKAGRRIVNTIGMEFVYISPGTFMMGSPRNEPGRDNDERQHRVTLTRGFYMQATEVTQGQWKGVMGYNPSSFKKCGDDCPVEQVSWNESQEFIQKLNKLEGTNRYRLPTEAEWEYASRAGTESPFSFGRCLSTDYANYNGKNPLKGCPKGSNRDKTVKVGSFPPNEWGLYDMHGNVWEWSQDWYGKYPSGHVIDPKGPSAGSHRALRGGRWSLGAEFCRSANRFKDIPDSWLNSLGFRLVRQAE